MNLQEFLKEYMDYWGEVTSMVETMGDAGALTAELRYYMTTAEDYDISKTMTALGNLYLSLNVLIDHAGRDEVMDIVTEIANQKIVEIERDKEEKGVTFEWDDEQNKLDVEEGGLK